MSNAFSSTAIFSRKNPQVVRFQKLHQKKYRKQEQAFIVEGLREIRTALDNGFVLSTCFYRDSLLPAQMAFTQSYNGHCYAATDDIMAYLSKRDNASDAVAIFEQKWADLAELKVTPQAFWVALESPKKPDNVGAVIRVAEAAGASGVILLDDFCDPYALESVRASTDAIFQLPLVAAKSADFLAWAAQQKVQVIGTSLENCIDYRQANYAAPTVMVMGTEYQGLSDTLQSACDQLVTIPMRGKTNSLNLSVASGILLYEISNTKFAQ